MVGFNSLNIEYKKELDNILPSLISSIKDCGNSNYLSMLINSLSKGLQEKQLDVLKILNDTLELGDGKNVVLETLLHLICHGSHRNFVHEQYINALLFLQKCEILTNLDRVSIHVTFNYKCDI